MERDEFRGGLSVTDQTKCPHCGAFERLRAGVNTGFRCGTASIAGRTLQSLECCKFERDSLKSKVAAQQELLKECRDTLCVLGTAYALDLVDKIDAKLEETK